MKVIDLLNKIANGEEVPKNIKVYHKSFTYINKWEQYINDDTDKPLLHIISEFNYSGLNDEVKIIEDKKIENNFQHVYNSDNDLIDANFENIRTTLENIIKVINEMREDK